LWTGRGLGKEEKWEREGTGKRGPGGSDERSWEGREKWKSEGKRDGGMEEEG